MMSQNQDDPVLAAALKVVKRIGEDFTMDQLALESGLSRATLYRKVGGRDALLTRLAALGVPSGEDIRTRVLRAAHAVFSAHGLLGSSMEQVAQEAGVGVATVYRHFGDKDTLVRSVVDHIAPRRMLRQLSLTPTADVRADLERLTRAALRAVYELRGLLRLSVFGSEAERAYLEHVRQGSERTATMLTRYFAAQTKAGRLRRGAEPEQLALAFIGFLFAFGVLGPTRLGTTLEHPDQTADLIVSLFLDGMILKKAVKPEKTPGSKKTVPPKETSNGKR
jgi:AcrR family transcriptional regulator